MLNDIQFRFLKKMWPHKPDQFAESFYQNKSKLRVLLGDRFLDKIQGKTVIDFGCGDGTEAIEMAQRGARRVIGLDIQKNLIEIARRKALELGLQNICVFADSTHELADIIVSLDAFEHFGDPGAILRIMGTLITAQGEVFVSFGPTWYHPLGGHMFSVFPWAHVIFSEKALIRWRATFKTDGATRFGEVAGGLNQITIKKFERLVHESGFSLANLELVPIARLRPFHNRLTREFTTAIVRCHLVRKPG